MRWLAESRRPRGAGSPVRHFIAMLSPLPTVSQYAHIHTPERDGRVRRVAFGPRDYAVAPMAQDMGTPDGALEPGAHSSPFLTHSLHGEPEFP